MVSAYYAVRESRSSRRETVEWFQRRPPAQNGVLYPSSFLGGDVQRDLPDYSPTRETGWLRKPSYDRLKADIQVSRGTVE